MADTLTRLEATVARRREAASPDSYVARLHAAGLPKIAQKTGEEAVETVIAALGPDPDALVGEAADLLFHLVVLLDARGVTMAEVLAELDRREGLSGLAEKASRGDGPAPLPASTAATAAIGTGAAAPAKRPRIRKG